MTEGRASAVLVSERVTSPSRSRAASPVQKRAALQRGSARRAPSGVELADRETAGGNEARGDEERSGRDERR